MPQARQGSRVHRRPEVLDNDITGSGRKRRPGWEALLEALEAGEAKAVLAYSSSRLYRNTADRLRLISLAAEHGIQIVTVASGELNPATAQGRMLAGILQEVDTAELETTRERVLLKQRELRSHGAWTGGGLPFGYDAVRKDDGRRYLVVNSAQATLVREAAAAVLNGVSLGSIVRDWQSRMIATTRGGRWTVSNLRAMLKRDNPGILVPTDTARLRRLFDGRTVEKPRAKQVLTGFLRCGLCGGSLISRPQRGKPSYVCMATGKLHLSIGARSAEFKVITEAQKRNVQGIGLVDPSEPLVAERERIEREMVALGESDLPELVLQGRARKLQRELERVDRQLERAAEVAVSPVYGGPEEEIFGYEMGPRTRAWLEQRVEYVVVKPAAPGLKLWDRLECHWTEASKTRRAVRE